MGRRIRKAIYRWNGSQWVGPVEDRKFVYNGWRTIMELDGLSNDAVVCKHTWGLDLSRLLEGPGGIGGLR